MSTTSMMSPSPAATNSSMPSGLTTMPRGRRETSMVLMVSSVSALSTVMVLSFSFDTKIIGVAEAKDGVAKASNAAAERAARAMQIMGLPLSMVTWENLHLVSGWSKPSVSVTLVGCRNPSCGEVETGTRVPPPSTIG